MEQRTTSPNPVRNRLSDGLGLFSLGFQRRLEIDLRTLGALLLTDLPFRARQLGKFHTIVRPTLGHGTSRESI